MSRRRRAIGLTIGARLSAMAVVLRASRAWSTQVGYSRKHGVGAVFGDPFHVARAMFLAFEGGLGVRGYF